MEFRIGQGFDVHRMEAGHALWIGGVKIPHEKGAVGHSDADVLLHAICDAILGAANLGDIGLHFPDTSDKFKGIDSKILLADTCSLLRSNGWEINNIDSSLCLEKPKILPHIQSMKLAIAQAASIKTNQISIKATTNERMGFVGREEGLTAYAVVLITRM